MVVDSKNLEIELGKVNLKKKTIIEYKGREYWINPIAESGHESPSSWYRSTDYSGADVYIWRNMKKKIKKQFTFHEIIEADLRLHEQFSECNSHIFSNVITDDYARRTLNDTTLDLYFKVKSQLYFKAYGPLVIPEETDFFTC